MVESPIYITEREEFFQKALTAEIEKKLQEGIETGDILVSEEEYKKLESFEPVEPRKIVIWMSPSGYRLWEKMMKDEAEKFGIKYIETGESSLPSPIYPTSMGGEYREEYREEEEEMP